MGSPQFATPAAPTRTVRWWTVRADDGRETTWVKITVGSRESCYWIEPLAPDRRVAQAAFRLHKEDGAHYDVTYDCHLGPFGAECTCADFTFRRANSPEPCKHILALRALQFFPQTNLDADEPTR